MSVSLERYGNVCFIHSQRSVGYAICNNFLASLGDSSLIWVEKSELQWLLSASGLQFRRLGFSLNDLILGEDETRTFRKLQICVSTLHLYMWYIVILYLGLRLIAKRSLNSVTFKKRSHCASIEANSYWKLKTQIWAEHMPAELGF